MDEQAQIELRGSVEDVTFYRPDTGFTVLDLNSEGELVTVVGVLPALSAGEELRLMGHWDVHASFGRQFRAELCERSLPSTAGQLLKYLSSGAVKGIRAATAEKIVEAFGDRTFDILENEPERLATIKGISREKAHKICEEFKKQFAVREVMIALESIGMTPAECLAAFRKFGASAIDRIHENPYILCSEDIHMGFERADVIAQAMPNRPDAIHRVRAGVIYVLRHNLHNGHTCIPREKLLTPSRDLLNTDTDTIEIALDGLLEDRQLVSKTIGSREFIFLPSVYSAEKSAAERIRIMLRFPLPENWRWKRRFSASSKKATFNMKRNSASPSRRPSRKACLSSPAGRALVRPPRSRAFSPCLSATGWMLPLPRRPAGRPSGCPS